LGTLRSDSRGETLKNRRLKRRGPHVESILQREGVEKLVPYGHRVFKLRWPYRRLKKESRIKEDSSAGVVRLRDEKRNVKHCHTGNTSADPADKLGRGATALNHANPG